MAVEIEWLILADAAQASAGKVHMLGAGWDQLTVNSPFPYEQHCAIVVAFKVPWNETNRRHGAEITIQHEDGRELGRMGGEFEVGRPPGIPQGSDQRAIIVAELGLKLEDFGTYAIVARTGEQERRTTFRVVPGPMYTLQQRQQEHER